jgi:C4-dicarboxylate transporter DctM subunit
MLDAAIAFVIVIGLVFARVPIAFAMAAVGTLGFVAERGWEPAIAIVGEKARRAALNDDLAVVPLFILMGVFVGRAGLSEKLYAASNAFLGHLRGGLAMATVVACGGFSAICGSSLATAATMAKVAMPSMRRYGYNDRLAAGAIAAGGTLGILIPPSVILVLYGIMARQDVGKLFAAGILPGILGVLCYLGAVRYVVARRPAYGPVGERTSWAGRWKAMSQVWGVAALFVLVIGGIYLGVFTPSEAGGIGAFGAFLFAVLGRQLNWSRLFGILAETAVTASMLFFVLIGALIFADYINETDMPNQLADLIKELDVQPMVVMLVILLIYLGLGCVFESLSMLLLTVPVFVPIVSALDFNLIWFGIVIVVVTEISLITPPIGMNVFVLRGVLKDVPTGAIFAGVTPFWVADIVRLSLLVLIPWISLFLPSMMD